MGDVTMTFAEAVHFMSGLRRFGIKLGNERIAELLRRLGDPHRRYGIAHITGTKGKGSTTAMIAAILTAHGYRTGGYFSPYVYDLCERVQLDGRLISRRDFARLVARIAPEVIAISHSDLGPVTEFELKTALGFSYFAEKKADFAAIEVGLGGRLDATNVVDSLVSVITNVGLDHTDVLGDTIAAIAREKAGIIKRRRPVITASQDPEALAVLSEAAAAQDAPLVRVVREDAPAACDVVRWCGTPAQFSVTTGSRSYCDLRLQLIGEHQCVNAACAIAAVEQMGQAAGFEVCEEAVRQGLLNVLLPGRFAVLHSSPTVIADGAHNEMSAQAVAAEIQKLNFERLILVVGMLRGHDPRAFLSHIAPMASVVFVTQPTWRRAQPAEEVARVAERYCHDVRVVLPPLCAARKALIEASERDLVLITGSFYTVGDVPPAKLLRTVNTRPEAAPTPAPQR